MENIIKLINDIFSMDFDVIIPVSGSIIAVLVAVVLFSLRYFTYKHNRKKYEKLQNQSREAAPETEEDKHEEELPGAETPKGDETLPDKKQDDKEVSDL